MNWAATTTYFINSYIYLVWNLYETVYIRTHSIRRAFSGHIMKTKHFLHLEMGIATYDINLHFKVTRNSWVPSIEREKTTKTLYLDMMLKSNICKSETWPIHSDPVVMTLRCRRAVTRGNKCSLNCAHPCDFTTGLLAIIFLVRDKVNNTPVCTLYISKWRSNVKTAVIANLTSEQLLPLYVFSGNVTSTKYIQRL